MGFKTFKKLLFPARLPHLTLLVQISTELHPTYLPRYWSPPRQEDREKAPNTCPRYLNPEKFPLSCQPADQKDRLSPPQAPKRLSWRLPGRFPPHTHESVSLSGPQGGNTSSSCDFPRLSGSLRTWLAWGLRSISWWTPGPGAGHLAEGRRTLSTCLLRALAVWIGSVAAVGRSRGRAPGSGASLYQKVIQTWWEAGRCCAVSA